MAKVLSCFLPETRSDWETPKDIFSWMDKKSWTIPVHFPNETSQLPERKGPRCWKFSRVKFGIAKVVVGSCWCLAKGRIFNLASCTYLNCWRSMHNGLGVRETYWCRHVLESQLGVCVRNHVSVWNNPLEGFNRQTSKHEWRKGEEVVGWQVLS